MGRGVWLEDGVDGRMERPGWVGGVDGGRWDGTGRDDGGSGIWMAEGPDGGGLDGGMEGRVDGGKRLDGGRLVGGMDGVKMRLGSRFDAACRFVRFAVFAVHRGGRFLAVRFRFAVRFTAFLGVCITSATSPCIDGQSWS